MWPKALTQLVELAPHLTRLAPLADRFLKDKATGDEGTRQALDAHRSALDSQRAAVTDLSDRLHADMGALSSQQTTQATQNAVLQGKLAAIEQQLGIVTRPIAELEKHLISTRADALAAKQATESLEGRLTRIEAAQKRTQQFTLAALVLLVIVLALLAVALLHGHS